MNCTFLLHSRFEFEMASEQINVAVEVDLSALPPNVPSLCIPRVFKNITRDRVMACFKDLNLGFVERIDMVPRKSDNGDEFQRVFVHLRWNRSEQASKARARVLAGKEIKIIYDEPWFWKVSANRSVSRDFTRDSHDSRAPRATLALEDDDLEGSIRKIKAQNDRDRKSGYRPRNHTQQQQQKAGGGSQHKHRPQKKPEVRPRSPSSSPPPIASAEASFGMALADTLAACKVGAAAARSPSPSPEVATACLDNCVSSLDVDTPTAVITGIDYGDCGKLPVPKKRRVIKPKMVVLPKEADFPKEADMESGEEKEA